MELGPALLPGPPELGMMSSRVPSLVCERLRAPSLVCERLRAPSRDVTLEPEAVRDLIKRVMLAEGTGERGESPVRGWAKAGGARTPATQPAVCPACPGTFAPVRPQGHPAAGPPVIPVPTRRGEEPGSGWVRTDGSHPGMNPPAGSRSQLSATRLPAVGL